MTGGQGTSNGQGANEGGPGGPGSGGPGGPKSSPDASEVVDHLKAASQEIAAAGKALMDMVEQAVSGFVSAMTGWVEQQTKPGGEKADKPRVERIDVEDDRKPKED